jgi:hypothetical protein
VDSVPFGVGGVDEGVRYASLNGSIFDRPLSPCDFQSLERPV